MLSVAKISAKKAVSPLIAVVLLIAITLAIGGFMSIWAQQITKTQTEQAVSATKPECQFVTLNAESANYTNSTTPPKLKFSVTNTGTRDTKATKVEIIYKDSSFAFAVMNTTDLKSGEKIPFILTNSTYSNGTIGDIRSDIGITRIITECPNANIEIKGSETAGTT